MKRETGRESVPVGVKEGVWRRGCGGGGVEEGVWRREIGRAHV